MEHNNLSLLYSELSSTPISQPLQSAANCSLKSSSTAHHSHKRSPSVAAWERIWKK
jgi:hypothetical protein